MKRAVTAAEMRAVDAAAAPLGMPATVLMENAGQALAAAAMRLASEHGCFVVLCGSGNNGGDGLVAARALAGRGRRVLVELVGEASRLTGAAEQNLRALVATGVVPAPAGSTAGVGRGDVIIDALLGTGLTRAPEGQYAEAIERLGRWRAAGARVLSADLPSGLHADLGVPLDPCVTADATVSFGLLKVGQVLEPGASRCGTLEVVDLGIPAVAVEAARSPAVWFMEEADARDRLPRRGVQTHKGSFGHVLVVAGSRGKSGAAGLAGLAALRAGAGLVTVATRPEVLDAVLQCGPELMGRDLSGAGPLGPADVPALLEAAEGKSAVVLGPGIPRGDETGALIERLVTELARPLVLDADGLNALAGRPEVLRSALGPVLLTPHPGELARLAGCSTQEIQADRLAAARNLAERTGAVVVLKGARTVVADPDGVAYVNPTGNPGMATGGTGDVLAGVCGALLAQGLSTTDAALVGVYAHGLAADLMVARTGALGLIASDLLAGLQAVWSAWDR